MSIRQLGGAEVLRGLVVDDVVFGEAEVFFGLSSMRAQRTTSGKERERKRAGSVGFKLENWAGVRFPLPFPDARRAPHAGHVASSVGVKGRDSFVKFDRDRYNTRMMIGFGRKKKNTTKNNGGLLQFFESSPNGP